MKHSTRLAVFLAGLLATQAAVPQRLEQNSLILDGLPPAALTADADLPQALDSRPTTLGDWLADGTLVVATRTGNTAQLHRLRTAMGTPEPLTASAEPVTDVVAHPYDASRMLYLRDNGGDERRQIWLRSLLTGNERLLTDGRSRHGLPVFARDGRRIAFSGDGRDGSSNDIYIADIDAEAVPRLVLAGNRDTLHVQEWSPDDRQLAVIRRHSGTDSELLLVEVSTGVRNKVELSAAPAAQRGRRAPASASPLASTSAAATIAVTQVRFSRDGRGLYVLSDRGGEFSGLHYYDLYTHQITTLTPAINVDIERFDLSQDGRFLAYTRNESGVNRLVLHDLALKADVLLPPLPAGAVISAALFDNASRHLAIALQTALSPEDIHIYALDTAAGMAAPPTAQLTRWTRSASGALDEAQLVPAEMVQFPTWDSTDGGPRAISAFVYRPRTPGPHPVLIDLHGGADSQHRPVWNSFRQYLVTRLGYAVIAPDVRGSSGHGRSFLALDDGELREDPLRDIGALLAWISLQPQFDRGRVAIRSEAPGGFLLLNALLLYGDRLSGGINTAGIGNFTDMQSIRAPLLIVHGFNDPRVAAGESAQMMAIARARGSEVWYLAARDEGRSLQKKSSSDAAHAAMAAFLKKLAGKK